MLAAGCLVWVGTFWLSSCSAFDPSAEGVQPPRTSGIPGMMHQGGMLDDELNFGRTYQ